MSPTRTGTRAPAILALAALALAAPLAALAQAPTQTFTNENLDSRTMSDAQIQASIVTSSTVRTSNAFDSRIHGASVFTSSIESSAISRSLLRNDRVRLAALDRATVEDSRLQGIIATRTAFRNAELNDFSIRGANVESGSLRNGIIQDVRLGGGVQLCNVYDRTSGRYFTTGCQQLGEQTRLESEVRGTGRDLEQTLLGALTLARNDQLLLPQIREQGFFIRAGEEAPSVDTALADISTGSVPDTGTETALPASAPGEIPALPAEGASATPIQAGGAEGLPGEPAAPPSGGAPRYSPSGGAGYPSVGQPSGYAPVGPEELDDDEDEEDMGLPP